jgi:hypothetical protein
MMYWHRKITHYCALAVTLFMVNGTAIAAAPEPGDTTSDVDEYFVPGAKWQESIVKTPDYPNDDDLIQVSIDSAGSNFEYFIDGKTLDIGNDDVVRYSVVIKSTGGAKNVMYEGIRCDTQEYRTYAFGTSEGKFYAARQSEWKRINNNISGPMAYREQFFNNYFCQSELPLKRHVILQHLKYESDTFKDESTSFW